jgi:hypothetical protein
LSNRSISRHAPSPELFEAAIGSARAGAAAPSAAATTITPTTFPMSPPRFPFRARKCREQRPAHAIRRSWRRAEQLGSHGVSAVRSASFAVRDRPSPRRRRPRRPETDRLRVVGVLGRPRQTVSAWSASSAARDKTVSAWSASSAARDKTVSASPWPLQRAGSMPVGWLTAATPSRTII